MQERQKQFPFPVWFMKDTGFYFKARAEGNASERTDWWLFRVPFQLEKMHGSSVQLQPRVLHILLIEGSISPSSRGRLPSWARGWLLAGDKVLSLPGSPGWEGTAAAERAGGKRGEHRGEQEEEQNSSCTCSHKSSLLNSLGNSHGTKFRGSLRGAKLAPAGEERKLLGKNN